MKTHRLLEQEYANFKVAMVYEILVTLSVAIEELSNGSNSE
jgi:hypothetical protein